MFKPGDILVSKNPSHSYDLIIEFISLEGYHTFTGRTLFSTRSKIGQTGSWLYPGLFVKLINGQTILSLD